MLEGKGGQQIAGVGRTHKGPKSGREGGREGEREGGPHSSPSFKMSPVPSGVWWTDNVFLLGLLEPYPAPCPLLPA